MNEDTNDTNERQSLRDNFAVRRRDGAKVVSALRDNVEVAFFDPEKLRAAIGDIERMGKRRAIQRLRILRAEGFVEPDGRFTEHNAITKTYRELLTELINPEEPTPNEEATHIAFGDDETDPDPDDEHLVNEVYRQEIDDHVTRTEDDQYAATVLIQSNDAVGENLLEASLVNTDDPENEDDIAFDRVLLDDPEDRLDPKSSDFAVTVTIEITYLDESQVA